MGLLEYIKDEAREEGKLEGILKSKHETAKKMLTSGVEIKLISNFTNLSTKEIQKIKREMDKK